jgi:glycerol-3-phosphate dehydrogenase (NAD(P)+)
MTSHQTNPSRSAPTVAILGIGQMGLVCSGMVSTDFAKSPSAPSSAAGLAGAVPWKVVLWGHSEDEAAHLAQHRTSQRLPGFVLPEQALVTPDLRRALRDAEIVVTAIPVQFMRSVWHDAAPLLRPDARVVSVAKGVENSSLLRPTQIVEEFMRSLGDRDSRARVAALSGPTIAPELARCLPAAMIAAGENDEFTKQIQQVFGTSWLRIYTHRDLVGVELAGAMKNIIAIAAGILDGLNAGYNAKSALLARGLAEVVRFGVAMGAQAETFFGIAGVGDLATTCFSPEGRNRSCGEALGRGERLETYLARTPSVVEGVATTKSVVELAKKLNVDMPITLAIHAVLFEGLDPIDAIGRLMTRATKAERVG